MSAVFKRGTLLVPSGPSHDPDKRHLHVVCTEPSEEGRVVLVPISTWINIHCDPTCILLRHEHSWLTAERSYVNYRKADLHQTAALERGLAENKIFTQAPCSGQVFLRIYRGLTASQHTKRKVKAYIKSLK